MRFRTEDGGDIPSVDVSTMDEVLESDAFGKFAILLASDEEFIQAANDWQSDEDTRIFLEDHDSDPWLLEYRKDGCLYRVDGHLTLNQVRSAFRSYLSAGKEWQSAFRWSDLR